MTDNHTGIDKQRSNDMTDSHKITLKEFIEIFGGEIPIEAYDLVFNGPGDMTVGETRERLQQMARAAAPAHRSDPMTDKLHEAIAEQISEGLGATLRKFCDSPEAKQARHYLHAMPKSDWNTLIGMLSEESAGAARAALAAAPQPAPAETFQNRVEPWMTACFGPEISGYRMERADRLLEEVLELLQSGDYPRERIAALTGYVWSRPKGEPAQEVGGVMVTLAAYCLAHSLDMHEAGETELARIWTKIEKIRAKQAAKPAGSALPQVWPEQPASVDREALVKVILDAMLGRYPGRDMARAVADTLIAAGMVNRPEAAVRDEALPVERDLAVYEIERVLKEHTGQYDSDFHRAHYVYDALENIGAICTTPTEPAGNMAEALVKAAQAVVDRWDSIDWKAPPTAEVMNELRRALASIGGQRNG